MAIMVRPRAIKWAPILAPRTRLFYKYFVFIIKKYLRCRSFLQIFSNLVETFLRQYLEQSCWLKESVHVYSQNFFVISRSTFEENYFLYLLKYNIKHVYKNRKPVCHYLPRSAYIFTANNLFQLVYILYNALCKFPIVLALMDITF